MHPLRGILLIAPLLAAVAAPSRALERWGPEKADETDSPWTASASCIVTYANICTGWIGYWTVSGSTKLGVVFDPCGENAVLEATTMRFSGYNYGYPAVLEVSTVDENRCPDVPLASQTIYPTTVWETQNWGIAVDGPVVITIRALEESITCRTNWPAAGPTGPVACGTCYPPQEQAHSYSFTSCPPEAYADAGCYFELIWSAAFSYANATEPATWSTIKALYR